MSLFIILIPVLGATVRFAARPLVDALLQSGALGSRAQFENAELARLTRRVLELEQEVARTKGELRGVSPITDERSDRDLPALRTKASLD